MANRQNSRLIRESENQMDDQRELMGMLSDLVEFIKSANPFHEKEDIEIQTAIKIKKNNILNHHMFEEFKENGFSIQDNVLKLSDWSESLKEAASLYMIRKNKSI